MSETDLEKNLKAAARQVRDDKGTKEDFIALAAMTFDLVMTECRHDWKPSWGASGPISVCSKCGAWEHD